MFEVYIYIYAKFSFLFGRIFYKREYYGEKKGNEKKKKKNKKKKKKKKETMKWYRIVLRAWRNQNQPGRETLGTKSLILLICISVSFNS